LNCLIALALEATQLTLSEEGDSTKVQHPENVYCDVYDGNTDLHIPHGYHCVIIWVEVCIADVTVNSKHHKCLVQQQHVLVTFSLHWLNATNQYNHYDNLRDTA
jgi:hypothetical protein